MNTSRMEDEAEAARLLISEAEVEEVRIAERRVPGQDNQGAPMETDSEGRAYMVMATAAATAFGEALAVERRDTVLIAGVDHRCNGFSSVALWPTEANATLDGVMQSSLATPMEAESEAASAEAEVTCGAEMGRQIGGDIFSIGDEGSLLESVLREKLLKSMRSKLLVFPRQQQTETTASAQELGLNTSRMEDEAGAIMPLISEAEVEEVRIAERRVPGPDNQGGPMETDSEGRASMVMATAAATAFGEALAVERRDTVLIARVDHRCNVFSSVALWPTEEVHATKEVPSSVLREKLLKSMRPRLPVSETTSRVPERGLGTSAYNWMENDAGVTRQLISAVAAVTEVRAGRLSENYGELMKIGIDGRADVVVAAAAATAAGEERSSGTLVGAGGRPKPANWSEMSRMQRTNWHRRSQKGYE